MLYSLCKAIYSTLMVGIMFPRSIMGRVLFWSGLWSVRAAVELCIEKLTYDQIWIMNTLEVVVDLGKSTCQMNKCNHIRRIVPKYILWDLWYFFQNSLINKKLKRTVFIQNSNFVLQYRLLFRSLGSVHFIFLSFLFFKEINTFIQQGC